MPIRWGAGPTARERGPVVCSRIGKNLLVRNSIGAHGGSYSVYRALSIAMGQLSPDWRPDLRHTHVSTCPQRHSDYSRLSSYLRNPAGSAMVQAEAMQETTATGRLYRSIPGAL